MMKVVALILCGLALAAANEHWESFKQTYGKSYTSNEDESYRKSIYEENQKKIDAHNERFRQGLVTFDMAMNQFGDMTTEEITAQMTGLLQVEKKSTSLHQRHPKAPKASIVDWRDKGAVTPVKDQGQCGSCWSFSATGALEGAHFLKKHELVSLSEQNLIDCSFTYGNMGCNGGVVQWAYDYIDDNNGVDTEASYPYEAEDGTCRFDAKDVGATVTGYKDIRRGSESDLEDAVQNVGPVSVAIDASHNSFQFYSSGVYIENACSPTNLDHAVLAVGYGTEGGQAYWLVKNSWAASWGDQGYIKMAKDMDNMCGIATQACYPTV